MLRKDAAPLHSRQRLSHHILIGLLQLLCSTIHIGRGSVHDFLLCIRQNVMPNPVPGIVIPQIRCIRTERNLLFLQPLFDFLPLKKKQGTDDLTLYRTDAAHSGKSCSPEQMKQHRFCTVIAVMCYRNPALTLTQNLPEGFIPDLSSHLFRRHLFLLCLCLHICTDQMKRNPPVFTQPPDKFRIPGSFRADAMINMDCFYRYRKLCSQLL